MAESGAAASGAAASGAPVDKGNDIAILGGGNLGRALARGWIETGLRLPEQIIITRRNPDALKDLADEGFTVSADNGAAVRRADTVILSVQPQQLKGLIDDIRDSLDEDTLVVSVVSGVSIRKIREHIGRDIPLVRAMPNTGVGIGQSMTCLAEAEEGRQLIDRVRPLFDAVGRTLVIREDMMVSATALCACGIAFFLRAIRAATQGGIEIGFHPDEALLLAAQTAYGAAALLADGDTHPEAEIDRVTTPRGCTIAGLNEMEHRGFSSALIKGVTTSFEKIATLGND